MQTCNFDRITKGQYLCSSSQAYSSVALIAFMAVFYAVENIIRKWLDVHCNVNVFVLKLKCHNDVKTNTSTKEQTYFHVAEDSR